MQPVCWRKGGWRTEKGREEEFQHKPPSIDTIENINRTDMKDGEKELVDTECRERKKARVKDRKRK